MTVNITGVKDTPINIDSNNNATVDSAGELHDLAGALGLSQEFLFTLLNGATFTEGANVTLITLLDKAVGSVDPEDPAAVEKLLAKFKEIEGNLPGAESHVEDLIKTVATKKAAYDNAPAGTAKQAAQTKLEEAEKELAVAREVVAKLKSEAATAKEQLQTASSKSFMKGEDALKAQIKQATGQAAAPKAAAAPDSPSPNTPFGAGNGTGGGGAGKAAADGKAGADPYAGFGNGAYKAGVDPYSAVDAVGFNDNFINDSWDMISESQKRQKMLMLFFYYAKMAMSGDIGAMYQFMRFLAHVIGRDKALQNVWMGTKLLELQEKSRQNTKDLLATDADDKDGAWTKKLQTIKGDENMIATSQKLITQMMEEFTQIVETLTNVQKSLLDVNGKVLSNLSQWR